MRSQACEDFNQMISEARVRMERGFVTKVGPEKSGQAVPLSGEQATNARSGIAIVNYMAQDWPDMAVTARVLTQRMAAPTKATERLGFGVVPMWGVDTPPGIGIIYPCAYGPKAAGLGM